MVIVQKAQEVYNQDMKFSMWIVNDWLEPFAPKPRITRGDMNIKGVRYFAEGIEPEEDLLYVGHAEDFISTGGTGVICANGEDLILLDTEDEYVIFNELHRMLEFYNDWENGIIRAIEESRPIGELLEMTLPVLNTTILITDSSHSMLGIRELPQRPDYYKMEDGHLSTQDVIMLNEILQQYTDRHGPYIVNGGHATQDIIRNFYARNGELIGWFVSMEGADQHVNSRMHLTEVFCRLLDFWFKINEEALLFSPQSALFIHILDGQETDPALIRFKQEGIGWADDPPLQLFVVRDLPSGQLDLQYLQRALSTSFSAVYCFKYLSDVLVIANYAKITEQEFLDQFADALRKRKTCCGSSYVFHDLPNLQLYYRQAQLALQYGEQKNGSINRCEDHALEYLRHQINDNVPLSISAPGLEALKRYDASAGTEYYRTLAVYLREERDQTKTANILCIHRNTLIYRIKKLEELLGTDLDDERQRFFLLFSLYLEDPEFFR